MNDKVGVPKGHVGLSVLSERIGIHHGSIRAALYDGRLDGINIGSRVYVRDIGDAAFFKVMPKATREAECLYRWLHEHDIRAMGERAVRETA